MTFTTIEILPEEHCDYYLDKIKNFTWQSGDHSAHESIHVLKQNKETAFNTLYEDMKNKPVCDEIVNRCLDNDKVWSYTLIKDFNAFILNKYDVGDHFKGHYDGFQMNNQRNDFSFTLFLNDDYKGGELVIEGQTIKPQKGYAVIYPSNQYHEVKPVLEGTRYAAIAWIRSLVKEDHIRDTISEILTLREYFKEKYGLEDSNFLTTQRIITRLFRQYIT